MEKASEEPLFNNAVNKTPVRITGTLFEKASEWCLIRNIDSISWSSKTPPKSQTPSLVILAGMTVVLLGAFVLRLLILFIGIWFILPLWSVAFLLIVILAIGFMVIWRGLSNDKDPVTTYTITMKTIGGKEFTLADMQGADFEAIKGALEKAISIC